MCMALLSSDQATILDLPGGKKGLVRDQDFRRDVDRRPVPARCLITQQIGSTMEHGVHHLALE